MTPAERQRKSRDKYRELHKPKSRKEEFFRKIVDLINLYSLLMPPDDLYDAVNEVEKKVHGGSKPGWSYALWLRTSYNQKHLEEVAELKRQRELNPLTNEEKGEMLYKLLEALHPQS
ncbi:hypothetical protein [Limnoglobus roseus]|uniref:Uncharacterized protein n=1 Tax=Limnoglobus roseus TaxID=2598579 RepID=A0A5C1A8W8_9BACT|nr:hypothetical protein [Limnoglobus roseus]QEL15799.1 hypothetical protein PX52LOC_02735 [Limnoglobus roseus]